MGPAPEGPVHVVGDVHGQLAKVIHLLGAAQLIDPDRLWTGGTIWTGGPATLWFLGDFFDRGPSGIGVVDLAIRLQREAASTGGAVQALLGNHEVLLLAAHHFGATPTGHGETFLSDWQRNGGQADDLAGLTGAHIAWLAALPAMARAGTSLLTHADATFYREYGNSMATVNLTITEILQGTSIKEWSTLLKQFVGRMAFDDNRLDGTAEARSFLQQYEATQLIHGHTPISAMTGQADTAVTAPLIYAAGLCVNCDGGMYKGGPGFLYNLPG